jgi:hypothetical protein
MAINANNIKQSIKCLCHVCRGPVKHFEVEMDYPTLNYEIIAYCHGEAQKFVCDPYFLEELKRKGYVWFFDKPPETYKKIVQKNNNEYITFTVNDFCKIAIRFHFFLQINFLG